MSASTINSGIASSWLLSYKSSIQFLIVISTSLSLLLSLRKISIRLLKSTTCSCPISSLIIIKILAASILIKLIKIALSTTIDLEELVTALTQLYTNQQESYTLIMHVVLLLKASMQKLSQC